MFDPAVAQILLDALDKDPANVSVRIHLANLYLDGAKPGEALEQLVIVLQDAPNHMDALKLAAQAAEAAGDKIRAHGYRQLFEALSWNQAKNLVDSSMDPDPMPPKGTTPSQPSLNRPPDDRIKVGGEDSATSHDDSMTEKPTITLDDVAGLENVKRRLNIAFLGPTRNPEMMKLFGRTLRGGLLLYGPPGCGKTYIARAIAGELGAKFLSVALSDVLDMWLGQSEKNLHEIFESARRNKPCVLFFDEIDALGRKRNQMRHSAGREVVNQLLSELDGVNADNEGVFILAATNHPWDVDTALRRPGRLDRTLLVLPPDAPARESLFKTTLRDRPVDGIDVAWLTKVTEDFSGADIAHLVESAAELAMEASLASGVVRPIRMNDMKAALKEVKPSTRAWFDTARNFALFANEGGAFDDLVDYLRSRRML